jgi:outer membrane protein assembly factor BamB
VAVAAGLMAAARFRFLQNDHAEANIATLVLGFLMVVTWTVWFCFFSGNAWRVRLAPLAIAGGLIIVVAALFRIDEVSGEMVPRFVFRWTPPRDTLLEKPRDAPLDDASTPPVDLSQTTEFDFPRFLGPEGTAAVELPRLARDWRSRPPTLVWRQPIGAGWGAFSAVNGMAVTLEQRGELEMVSCYEIATGRLRWWHALPARHADILGGVGPRGTPAIHEGKVYALGATGWLRCLDGATGKPAWPPIDVTAQVGIPPGTDNKSVAWGRAASPLVVDDLVVVPAGGPAGGGKVSLIAYDKNTGQERWRGGDQQVSYSSPLVATLAGKRQIVIVNEATVTGHDMQTGAELWRIEWPGSSTANASASQAVPVSGDRLFLSKGYRGGAGLYQFAFSESAGWSIEPVWHDTRVMGTKFANVAVRDGFVYGLSDGILECIELATGHRQWKEGRYAQGQILRVADLMLVQAESGEVALVEATPEEFRELGRFRAIEGKTWNNLCLYGSVLLVRNAQEAAAYELPLAE